MVRLGLWYDFRNPPQWRRPLGELYAETFEQIRWAEQLGFDDIWLSEHHFIDDDHASGVLPLLGAIAAQTSRVRLGTSVMLLPLHDPVRLAEDAATVDVVSGGRLDLGVAVGYRVGEFTGFGIDPRTRGRRMEEALTVLTGFLNGGLTDFEGRYFRYHGIQLNPRPLQRPVPVWVAALSPAALERAARLGDGLLGGAGPDMSADYVRQREGLGRSGPLRVATPTPWIAISNDPERTWARIGPHVLYQRRLYAAWLAESGLPLFGDPPNTPDEIRAAQPTVVVTPDQALALLHEKLSAAPATTHLTWGHTPPGVPPAEVAESVRLAAEHVLPYLHGLPSARQ
jgi:probable F420-dependent oxidoreductase